MPKNRYPWSLHLFILPVRICRRSGVSYSRQNSQIMKTIAYILFCIVIVFACSSERKEAKTLLEDPAMQEDIFNVILSDSVYFKEFLDQMHATYPPMQGMRGRMMKRMYGLAGMDSLVTTDSLIRKRMLRHMLSQADRDSAFCRQMSQSIMQHQPLRKRLRQHMGVPN